MKVAVCIALAFFLKQTDAGKGERPPFSITIKAVPSSVIQAGQRFYVAIVLTNLTDHSIDAPSEQFNGHKPFDPTYRFDIRDSAGKQIQWVAPNDVAGIVAASSGTLQAGKSRTDVEEIDEFFDLSKPGDYSIQAIRPAAFTIIPATCEPGDVDENGYVKVCEPGNRMGVKMDLTKGEIQSNTITITVVPAKSEGSH